jgi:hypothetical protein
MTQVDTLPFPKTACGAASNHPGSFVCNQRTLPPVNNTESLHTNMEQRIADRRRKLAQSEEQAEEEQHLREAAEGDAQQCQKLNLFKYLKACHRFYRALEFETDKSLTTQGNTTDPVGRLYPQRITSWASFPAQQQKVWEKLENNADFQSQPRYPSTHQLAYVRDHICRISSELDLRQYAHETVETPVQTLIREIYKNGELSEQLQLQGAVIFKNHTNLGQTSETSIDTEIRHLTITESKPSKAKRQTQKSKGKQAGERAKPDIKGSKIGRADQFCICERGGRKQVLVALIEYKPPHKFPKAEIAAGCGEEIRLSEEFFNRKGDGSDSKYLVAAVVTQLFSSMIGKNVQRGYIFTGEAIIFLFIPKDPTTVLYHLFVPDWNLHEEDKNGFHMTNVAQIAAFVLTALTAEDPSKSWQDAARSHLKPWPVEYNNILEDIPQTPTDELSEPSEPSYKVSSWTIPLPIASRLRSACTGNSSANDQAHDNGGEDNDNDTSRPLPSPTLGQATRRRVGQGKGSAV